LLTVRRSNGTVYRHPNFRKSGFRRDANRRTGKRNL
jgi:hypothetical protein